MVKEKTTTEDPQEKVNEEMPEAVAPIKHVVEEAQKKGFRGTEADPTPNENYTVGGVAQNLPTPETDEAQSESVRAHLKEQRKEL